jgi:prophage regulatory protein
MSQADRIIRLKTVLDRTGLSRSTLYRKITEGTFPQQLKISVHGAGWHESSVNRWIANKSDEYSYVFSQKGNGYLYMNATQNEKRTNLLYATIALFVTSAIIWNIPLRKASKPA